MRKLTLKEALEIAKVDDLLQRKGDDQWIVIPAALASKEYSRIKQLRREMDEFGKEVKAFGDMVSELLEKNRKLLEKNCKEPEKPISKYCPICGKFWLTELEWCPDCIDDIPF